ncbi:hypothetical protein BGZ51_007161 [Haplosporangium sp. Z 767]|nr:hypothetical protein BGZ50_007199 [Haplosporangium sp. Z 11]KAF9179197.1 hypothetical protein BGZ51_007161 [Haplosporangium sp. Z 767]
MKYTIIIAAVMTLVQAAPLISNGVKAITDSYIVVLKNGQTPESFQAKFNNISRRQSGRGRKFTIHRKYNKFGGFAATLNKAALKEILASDEVEYVEQDAVVSISGTESSPTWGLARVSQRNLNNNADYLYNDAAGEGITAYVIDTGIYVGHSEFGGRASWGANFISGSADIDENGHGTHVAGTIGGTKYGVAKKANLVGVKVLDANGDGTNSGVIAGMDWVAEHAEAGKSVVNMSLGGDKSRAVDDAVARLFNANIPVIVAAGNSATDACDGSPSGASNAYTVTASDKYDNAVWSYSYGTCVEIFGPGYNVTSAWIGSSSAINTISGTSMATPHVAGVAALYMSFNSFPTAQSVYDKLTSTATPDKITGNLRGTPNRLAYNGGV